MRASVAFLIALMAPCVSADPWLAPGDERLRSDVQLLADAGILRGPVTTWPISWPDIARDVVSAEGDGLDEATAIALLRVQRLARQASTSGFSGIGMRVRAAREPDELRGFADTPREEGEIGFKASWLTEHFAMNLQGSYVVDPDDDMAWRADGSYMGVNFGNYMLSVGFMERWWGPGWDGGLILSTNARPVPSITLERNYTDPFETKWLSWIGPWRASIAVGQTEGSDVAVKNVRFFAARVNFRPRPWLELALTRSAQVCGNDRECSWETFGDLLVGNDNQVEDGEPSAAQPGNQMAGYDLRLSSPWRSLPLAFYTQLIGEDEAGGLPSKFIGLLGLESWGSIGLNGWRARVEYAGTACNFSREVPEFNCAFRNTLYPQGYTYRGRIIGHAMDNDSRMYSLGMSLSRPGGDLLSATLRRVELNRDGGPHTISENPLDLNNVELRYSRDVVFGQVSVGLGFEERHATADSDTEFRGFLVWQQGF